MAKMSSILSFNRHYLSASLVYLGMAFLLTVAVPEIARHAHADEETAGCTHVVTHIIEGSTITETVPGCAAGYTCCEATGECVELE